MGGGGSICNLCNDQSPIEKFLPKCLQIKECKIRKWGGLTLNRTAAHTVHLFGTYLLGLVKFLHCLLQYNSLPSTPRQSVVFWRNGMACSMHIEGLSFWTLKEIQMGLNLRMVAIDCQNNKLFENCLKMINLLSICIKHLLVWAIKMTQNFNFINNGRLKML